MNVTNWFESLFGFREFGVDSNVSSDNYRSNQNSFRIEDGTENNLYIVSIANHRKFCVGSFECKALAQLRTETRNSVITSRISSTTSYANIAVDDILEMHAINPGATFQAASQFNCLEFISPDITPEHGVTCYAKDGTQGPACAIACAAATIYRNYFACIYSLDQATPGQTKTNQINNLRHLELLLDNDAHGFWTVRNGYVFSSKESLSQLNRELERRTSMGEESDLEGSIMVGVQKNTEVTFNRRFEAISESSEKVLVNQVFCSALSCNYSGIPTEHWEKFARLVLNASYEATLWAAMTTTAPPDGSNRVLYLTFLGGGVFGNRPEWVAEAIGRAIAIAYLNDVPIDIIICHFRKINNRMKDLIEQAVQDELTSCRRP